MDPLQWMGAVRMTVQTDDKSIESITIIYKYQHDPSASINILWSVKLCVCKKQIHHEGI